MNAEDELLRAFFDVVRPYVPLLVVLLAVRVIYSFPMPGRGPGLQARDPWRCFKFQARHRVFSRAGGRCEGSAFLAWGRCSHAAEQIDHIYPWSKGGATIVSNGQALCRRHNRAKANHTPAWWYIAALERRRKRYFPDDESIRVSPVMNDGDQAARIAWQRRQPGQGWSKRGFA